MIDWTKPIETSDGQECRYIGTYKQHGMRWHIVAVQCGGDEVPWTVNDEGRKSLCALASVRNVPMKHNTWRNCYGDILGSATYDSRDDAELYAGTGCTARIRVEWQDGEGLT